MNENTVQKRKTKKRNINTKILNQKKRKLGKMVQE